ncbi:hypothetical protein FRZ61_50000 [Hypericibacter adhaerens]|uniref:Uncharacterized protein n=1 Tax=Hypericibacter adhaerens TaxID=2602016 RepID=A0A5J6N7J1_9PROT|nr:hypothetical protein [Hypericibacter adhaerens]QEX25055.1 hypothetical protein FRZ61_50000 [Hypericibacter adhaerens]
MENDHVLSGLIRKRAELAGEIDHLATVVQQKMIELDHLDATIRIFKPDIDLETVKPRTVPPRHQALPGEMIRGVLTVLRESKAPLSSMEITLRLMERRVMNTADKMLVRTVSKRVVACVRHSRAKGLLRSTKTPGQQLLWEIAR